MRQCFAIMNLLHNFPVPALNSAARACSPRFLWMRPNARISVMGGERAASALATVKHDGIAAKSGQRSAEEEAFKAPIRQQYEDQGPPYYANALLRDDGIIAPRRRLLRAGPGPCCCARSCGDE